jgi:Protein of unknown function (DUF2975)
MNGPRALTAMALLSAAPLDRRLARLCKCVRAMVLLGAIILALLPLVFWFMPSSATEWVSQATSLPADAVRPVALTPLLATVATLLPVGLGLAALWQLWQLFGAFAAGRALTHEAQQHLRRFALVLLAITVCEPIYRATTSLLFSLGNPPGQRMLVVSLSSDDYLQGMLALVLLAIAIVMGDAVRAADENRAFV